MSKKENSFKKALGMLTIDSLKETIVDDVIIPGFKNLLSSVADGFLDTVGDIVDVALFGERRSKGRNSNRASKVSYSDYYDKRNTKTSKDISRMDRMKEVTFDNRYDAEDVLDSIRDILEEANEVSVADYYEVVGEEHNFMDRRYGWTNLKNAYVSKTRDGDYIINLPKPRLLD